MLQLQIIISWLLLYVWQSVTVTHIQQSEECNLGLGTGGIEDGCILHKISLKSYELRIKVNFCGSIVIFAETTVPRGCCLGSNNLQKKNN